MLIYLTFKKNWVFGFSVVLVLYDTLEYKI
jgi:hypothetical protein